MLGGIFIAHLKLSPRRTTFGVDGPITDTFPGSGGQFLATKNGPPRPLLAPDRIFRDSPQRSLSMWHIHEILPELIVNWAPLNVAD